MAANRINCDGKIGFDARGAFWYRGTGIGTYSYQLAANLSRLAAGQVEYVLPGSEYTDFDFADSVQCSLAETSSDYFGDVFLPCWLEQNKIRLYHVPQNGIGLPCAAACRKVVTVHDLIPYVYPETVGRNYLKEFLRQMPQIMANTDGIIAVSEHTKQDIMRFFDYPEERIAVIYEAAEPIYAPTARSACQGVVQRLYGVEGDFLLYVGGFGARKNLSGLLAAFARALPQLKNPLKLVCPGRNSRDKSYLKELCRALDIEDRVSFPGFVPLNLLPSFYGAATALVYPSYYEGFGLPVLEAMACGCPVLAADNSSIPEIGGSAAVYFDAYDADSISKTIIRTVNDEELLNKMSYDGLRHSAEFCWQKNAEETLAFYEKIISMPQK